MLRRRNETSLLRLMSVLRNQPVGSINKKTALLFAQREMFPQFECAQAIFIYHFGFGFCHWG